MLNCTKQKKRKMSNRLNALGTFGHIVRESHPDCSGETIREKARIGRVLKILNPDNRIQQAGKKKGGGGGGSCVLLRQRRGYRAERRGKKIKGLVSILKT